MLATTATIVAAGAAAALVSPPLHSQPSASYACHTPNTSSLPFCDPAQPFSARVADLVGRLTLEEKLSLTSSTHQPVPRLGIPGYSWGNECLHGAVVKADSTPASIPANGATVFPQPIGLAATFDEQLLLDVGTAISDESRGLSNAGGAAGSTPAFLDCWAPNINIFRDPRWGRGSETYGEDPTLTSTMLLAFLKGLQGNSSVAQAETGEQFIKVASVLKHFVAYSLEEADGEMRFYFDAEVTPQDLQDTYLPAFKAGVTSGNARGVMCSYNQVNGTPMCANGELLGGTLRNEWGFTGHVVSDCGAVVNAYQYRQDNTSSLADASARAIKAGTDMNCGSAYTDSLADAVAAGMVSEADLNHAITHSLLTRFELGMFDPEAAATGENPYANISASVVGSQAHIDLARKAAGDSVVLLKNNDHTLPLLHTNVSVATARTALKYKRIAVVGPSANDSLLLLGNYHGLPATTAAAEAEGGSASTPLMALQHRLKDTGVNISYAPGLPVIVGDGVWEFGGAIDAARDADVVVAFLGSSAKGSFNGTTHLDTIEKEGMDRTDLSLPPLQSDLIRAISKFSETPIVVVLIQGGPLAVEDLIQNPQVKSIASAWFPGQAGGAGVSDVLVGDKSPAAKLPVTVYAANYTTQIAATNMNMRTWPGRTYRFLDVPALYPFGYGLSYSTFEYQNLQVGQRGSGSTREWAVTVQCQNIGDVPSDEVVLLFTSFTGGQSNVLAPKKELHGFQKLRSVQPGETRRATFVLLPSDFELVDSAGARVMALGDWRFQIGAPLPQSLLEARARDIAMARPVATTVTIR